MIKSIGLGILALVALTFTLFYFGFIGNIFDSTVGKQHLDIQRTNFERSKPYIQGKIDDLAKYKREYDTAQTKDEKQQVKNYILSDFANFNTNDIQNSDLRNFLLTLEGN
jgi:hypothetical protein